MENAWRRERGDVIHPRAVGCDLLDARTMDKGRKDEDARDQDDEDGAGRRAFLRAEQYIQYGLDIPEARTMDRGGEDGSAIN